MNFNQQKYLVIAFVVLLIVAGLIFQQNKKKHSPRRRVVSTARKFLGQEETGSNKGFKSRYFENLMRSVGWRSGQQWCAYFGRLVWLSALPQKYKERAKQLLSGSSQQTYLNFANDKSEMFEVSKKPKVGSLVIWQSRQDGTRGHVGIVIKVKGDCIYTIEGNSNKGGSPGIVATFKYCKTDNFAKGKNLKLRGFVNIK